MASLYDLKQPHTGNIRKVLDAAVFVAPVSAPVPANFTTDGELNELPPEYRCIGWVTKDDGLNWTREVDTAEVTSHGSLEPTRRDINSDVSGLEMTAQETSRLTLELSNGVDLSTATVVNGELSYTRSTAPCTKYYRVIAIGQDGCGADKFYIINILPRATVTDFGDSTWSDEDELTYPLTWSAMVDDGEGYAFRQVLAGNGFLAQAEDMGFGGSSS